MTDRMTDRVTLETPETDVTAQPDTAVVPLRRNMDFIRLWVGAGISRFGTSVSVVAYPMLVLWQTGSAAATGSVGFAGALPNLLVQLPAGALVDRWDRRRVLMWCDALRLLAFTAVGVAAFAGRVWVPLVMAAAFIEGTLGIFYQRAEQAAVRRVVPDTQLPAALAQNQARGAAIGLLGQPLSGLLFTVVRWLPFAFTAVANAVALLCLVLIRRDLSVARTEPPARLHIEIKDGIAWLWRRPFLRIMTAVFAGSNLAFQVLGLTLMVLIKDNGGSPAVLGLVSAVAGIGALLGAFAASWWSARFSLYTTAVLGHLVWLVLMPALTLLTSPVAIGLVAGGIMFVASLFNVTGNVYMARTIPDDLQGRVTGTSAFLTSGANALGSLLGGYALAGLGAVRTGAAVGALVLLLTVTVAFSPTVRAESRGARGAEG
ncbi:MFS transporter [Streptomyces sp. NRRL B-3229]|uniref:MFS transporter n=1 Tax=Streptomyces sp. NRRL B-3229 TaxID=1463836 RepID=UPI00099D1435|nr:MFS transporter [Streptomyces sp. NRRL B-3229]